MAEIVETVAERMAAGGDALARMPDGRVLFASGALPGERVSVQVRQSRKDFAKGSVLEVLDASPHRVQPPCPELARGCGGCGWQHLAPRAQLDLKADIVRDALRRTARLPEVPVHVGAAVAAHGYRTTVRVAVTDGGRVGFRAASSNRVVSVDGCMVAHPLLSSLLPRLRVSGAAEVQLRVSRHTGEVTVLPLDARGAPTRAQVQGLPQGVGVGAGAQLVERVAGRPLRVSAASFFQSGPDAAELLVSTVAGMLGRTTGRFLDAYGGVGLFGATLAEGDVVLVEGAPSSCADARVNLPEATVVQSRFEDWEPVEVDAAVADPARSGLGSRAVGVLVATRARQLVLVSCDPVSMARDVALLGGHGYRLRSTTVLDLFPHTPHVEVVSSFHQA
jgi:23S rRNA (uracil1939-C5)-methyltransferase